MISVMSVCGVDIFLVAYFVMSNFCLMSRGRQWASHNKLSTELDLKASKAILIPAFCTVFSIFRVLELAKL